MYPCRYEVHHGVRINDSALVEAAVLSDRYIADRFLPDKVRGWRASLGDGQDNKRRGMGLSWCRG